MSPASPAADGPAPSPRPARLVRARTYPPYRPYGDGTPAPGTKPIWLYLRLSKYHGDKQDAIERQRLDLTRKIHAQGNWTIIGEYVDNDSASASAVRTRRGWQQLNEDLEAGRLPAVAFWKLDRTNRIGWETLRWLAHCRERRVYLMSHQDSEDELNERTAAAKLVTGVKAIMAEVETDTMSERQLAAKAHLAEAGFYHGGQVPFGWIAGPRETDSHGRTGVRLMPHPVEHPALKEAIDMVLAGSSLATVARHWKDAYGITTAGGEPIYLATVLRALRSPRCMGYRLHKVPERKRGDIVDLMQYVVRRADGEPVIAQEPVCDRATWLRVQRAITDARTHGGKAAWGTREWLLTGVLWCVCGQRLYGAQKKPSPDVKTYAYKCLAKQRVTGTTCPGVSITADKLEDFIYGWIEGHLTPERIAQAQRQAVEGRTDRGRAAIEDELQEAREERDALLASQRAGSHRGATVTVLLGLLDEVNSRIEGLERRLDLHAPRASELAAYRELFDDWNRITADQRRFLVRSVVARVEVSPGRGQVSRRVAVIPAV